MSLQNHYNLIYREEEREMIPLCRAEGIGVIPWSPLARGFLAGNRARSDDGETVRSQTDGYAAEMYYQDVAALEIRLTEDEIRSLEQPYVPHPVLGHS